MSQQTQERNIDGTTYTVTQFSATKSLKIVHRLGRYISEPLTMMASGTGGVSGFKDADISKLGSAIQSFFSACDESHFESTIKDLLGSTTKEGKPLNFDIEFSGKLAHLFKLLAFIIEVNFKDFFPASIGLKS